MFESSKVVFFLFSRVDCSFQTCAEYNFRCENIILILTVSFPGNDIEFALEHAKDNVVLE